MWSFVNSKKEQRWLWHAINHDTGEILAYVLSGHKDEAFLTGQCEVLGKSTSLLGFQPPTHINSLQDSRSLKGFQCKAFRHSVKMSDRELPTHQSFNMKILLLMQPC